ncbi:MAG: hypothetical protein GC137_09685 [Alphaproteobacteria bacterium]|nr:hypothetical protein [Alphaproteobacteria bacterium]
MNFSDPSFDPSSAPLMSSETNQPFARRTISFFITLIVFILFLAFLSGWFASSDDEKADSLTEKAETVKTIETDHPPKTTRQGIYDFFYTMFSGIKDGLEDHPMNLKNTPADSVQKAVAYEQTFNGKILDYEGNIAGDISAIEYADGELKSFRFELEESLTPTDKARRYTVPADEIKVVQNGDLFFIQLSKEQTAALAKELYDEPSE